MDAHVNGNQRDWGRIVLWGGVAGLIGGIVMAMLMMIVTAVMGMGFLRPLYLIAATFHSAWAMTSGFDLAPFVVGAMVHMVNSIIFGIIFVLLLTWIVRRSLGAGAVVSVVIAGMVWGLILLVVNQFITLQLFDPSMAKAVTMNGAIFIWWLIAHLVFGGVTGAIVSASLNRAYGPMLRPQTPQPAHERASW